MQFIALDFNPAAVPVGLLFRKQDGGNHRRCVTPGADMSDLPAKAQERIAVHWESLGGDAAWQAIAYPPPAPATAADIKAEAERRILAVLPEWKQRNLTARGIELLLALVKNRGWTAAETAEATAIQADWDKVKAIRARSDDLEQELPADCMANRNWPA